jgi:hypothetical protein
MKDAAWYVLIWIAPAAPSEDAYFAHEGLFETREAAVTAARAARVVPCEDRFVRVIASVDAPTGEQWDEAEEIDW